MPGQMIQIAMILAVLGAMLLTFPFDGGGTPQH
jgi:hypothetical protein